MHYLKLYYAYKSFFRIINKPYTHFKRLKIKFILSTDSLKDLRPLNGV